MPYVMVDELGEGQEEAYVVDRNEYDAAIKDRDALLERTVQAEDAYKALKDKYVKAVLGAKPIEQEHPQKVTATTFDNLF